MSDNEYRVVRIDPIEGEIPQLWDARLSAPIYTLRILITLDDGDDVRCNGDSPAKCTRWLKAGQAAVFPHQWATGQVQS